MMCKHSGDEPCLYSSCVHVSNGSSVEYIMS